MRFDPAGAGLVEGLHGPPWPRQVREKRGTQKRQKEEAGEEVNMFYFTDPERFYLETI